MLIESLYKVTEKLELTQGKSAIVDADDFDRVNEFKWQYNKKGTGYAQRIQYIGMKDGKRIKKQYICTDLL